MRILFALTLVAGIASARAEPLAAAPPVRAALAAIDRTIESDRAAHAIPGIQVAIVHDRAILWSRDYGTADLATGEPVTERTRFVIGSVSKLFTALAIVELRDAGKLDLDERVSRLLPWFRLAAEPHPTITLRELLLQLGGLPREPLGASWQDRVMPDRAALIADLPREIQALPPETRWKYSNLGYAVLGLAVEAASGESWGSYVTRHILLPLGMRRTVAAPDAATPGLATGYSIPLDGVRAARKFLDMGGVTPAAGIASTARDLARFMIWMLDDGDGPVLAAQSRREMMRVQALIGDGPDGQGLGFEIRRRGGTVRIGHAGLAAGYAARVEVDPASRLGIVLLANADDAALGRVADAALATLAPAVATALPPPPPAVPDPGWRAYVGTYVSPERRESGIAIVEGRLAWIDPADPARSRIFLDPAGPDRFRFAAGGLVGEILVFERDAAGRVVAMRAGGNTDRRR